MTIFWLDRPKVREALEALIDERYRPDARVLGVVLFGSFARGDAVPGSDIDLLIVLDRDERSPRDRIPDYRPDEVGGAGADVIPWTLAELAERLAAGDRFARSVLCEGEILFDRRGLLRAAQETRGR